MPVRIFFSLPKSISCEVSTFLKCLWIDSLASGTKIDFFVITHDKISQPAVFFGSLCSVTFTKTDYPLDIKRKLNVHRTLSRRPGYLLNVLCTFMLRLLFILRLVLSINLCNHSVITRFANQEVMQNLSTFFYVNIASGHTQRKCELIWEYLRRWYEVKNGFLKGIYNIFLTWYYLPRSWKKTHKFEKRSAFKVWSHFLFWYTKYWQFFFVFYNNKLYKTSQAEVWSCEFQHENLNKNKILPNERAYQDMNLL